jgi:hypothetical protein
MGIDSRIEIPEKLLLQGFVCLERHLHQGIREVRVASSKGIAY